MVDLSTATISREQVQAATAKTAVKLGHLDKAQPTMTEAIAMPDPPTSRIEG